MRSWSSRAKIWLRAVPLVTAVALLGATPHQVPYVRTTVDASDPNAHCLYWPAGPVTIQQSSAGDATTPTAFAGITKSWETWEAQMQACGNLTISEGPRVNSRSIGYDAKVTSTNTNLVLFRPRMCSDVVPANASCANDDPSTCNNDYDCWSYDDSVIALTTNTYDANSGRIFDSDMELNAAGFYFTTVDSPRCASGEKDQSCVAYDVQNTATHEFGHLLGLSHSPDPHSTMYASAPQGQLGKRTLDDGSLAFVCDVYPKGQPSQDCVTGSSSNALNSGGCAVGGGGAGSALLAAAVALSGLTLRSRRKASRP